MNEYDAIKEMCNTCGSNLRRLSMSLGKSENYINNAISAGKRRGTRLKLDTFVAIAEQCNYSVVVAPKGEEPPNGLVID